MCFSDVTFPDGGDFSATRFPPNADFSDATLEDADFSGANVTGTDNFSTASFDGADLTDANFSNANLRGASFERARLSRAELLGTNFAGAKLYGALLGDGEPNLEKAGEVYATLENLARDNSLPGLASECFLGRKDVQFREYWRDGNTGMLVRSFVPNLVARYGESPARVLVTGAVTVLACGLVYNAFDLVEHADSGDSTTLFEALHFSGLTFTTLGYGDFNPANELGQVLAVTETSIGVVLLAILVFVFGRRATR